MELNGIVQNGVIVLTEDVSLPEGTAVRVSCEVESISDQAVPKGQRVQLPLIQTGEPGSVDLTNERIAEIFEEEDIAYAARFLATSPKGQEHHDTR